MLKIKKSLAVAALILSTTFLTAACADNAHSAVDGTAADAVHLQDGPAGYFNGYILKSVLELSNRFRLLGYNINGVLTHDIPYLNLGTVRATMGGKTMCVAAQLEVILTAMQIYYDETHDPTPYKFLPLHSWQGLGVNDIRGHLWVNEDFNSDGAADALHNFGMGERVPFEKLAPGSFINLNRELPHPTGHAVIFLAYIDRAGHEFTTYNSSVIGFKYFSSQGGSAPGAGGFDFRDAIFTKFGCPENMPLKRDCNVMYSSNPRYLNTGMMWTPPNWEHPLSPKINGAAVGRETVFNADYFNGQTTDD